MSDSNSGGGVGFTGLLFITFLVLKLCDVITWSWWWITAPIWGVIVLIVLVIGGYFSFVELKSIFKRKAKK